MELKQALARLYEIQHTTAAYRHALGVLEYDAVTAAPEKSAAGRGETLAVLGSAMYELSAGEEMQTLITFLKGQSDQLTAEQRRAVELLSDDYDRTACIPKEEYVEYARVQNDADSVWHRAKPANDYASFAPYLEKLIDYQRRFALYYKKDSDPYETLLDEFEKGITVKKLDTFFASLREQLVPLIHKISAAEQVDDSFLHGDFPVWKQRILSDRIMDIMHIDRTRCVIGETLHPFTTEFNVNDVRITTNYRKDNFADSMYSVIHEGGHALYELGGNPEYDGTVLSGGASLGIHESQSRFYENIIGRSHAFCSLILPTVKELFPELSGVSENDFYRAINKSQPSLIRTMADELTYPLHIMVRYEIEKRLIGGSLSVKELPAEWNRLYKEYLGVDVPDDEHGVLQDSHWSGGAFGYFPSYALGSAYSAQFVAEMGKELDVDAAIKSGDLTPINEWLGSNIHHYSSLYDPAELMRRTFRGEFNPQFYVDYLVKKYSAVYNLN